MGVGKTGDKRQHFDNTQVTTDTISGRRLGRKIFGDETKLFGSCEPAPAMSDGLEASFKSRVGLAYLLHEKVNVHCQLRSVRSRQEAIIDV